MASAVQSSKKIKVKFQLDKLCRYIIFWPHVVLNKDQLKNNKGSGFDDTYPLFARSDRIGYQGRSPQWLQTIETVFNSPRNIQSISLASNVSQSSLYIYPDKLNGKTSPLMYKAVSACYPDYPYLWEELKDAVKSTGIANDPITFWAKTLLDRGTAPDIETKNYTVSLSGYISKSFDRDWSLKNLESFTIGPLLVLEYRDNPSVLKQLNLVIQTAAKVDWTRPDKYGYYDFYYNGVATPGFVKQSREFKNDGISIYPYPINLAKKDKSVFATTSLFFTNLITTMLNGGKPVTFKSNGAIEEYPRLKYISFLWSFDNDTFAISGTKKTSLSGGGFSLANGPLHFSGKSVSKSAWLVMTGVNQYLAPFSTNEIWLFDKIFLAPASRDLEAIGKKRMTADIGVGDRIKRDTDTTANTNKPEQSQQEDIQRVIINSGQSNVPFDSEATNSLERELNKQYSMHPIVARTSLIVMAQSQGVARVLAEISKFTEKGQALYKGLLDSKVKGE